MTAPDPIPWFDVVIILALIVLNGVLSMSELAIVSSREARLTDRDGSRTNRDHLRVRRGVEASAHFVASFGDDLAIASHYRANRHLAGGGGFRGKFQRSAHRCWQREGHKRCANAAQRQSRRAQLLRRVGCRRRLGRVGSRLGRTIDCDGGGRNRNVGLFCAHSDRAGFDIEGRRLAAGCGDPVSRRGNVRRLGFARLVNVNEAGHHQDDQCNDSQNEY